MSAQQIPLGASAPLELEVLITTADPALDLTTVTGVSFSVRREYDQQTVTWNGTASGPPATSTRLTATHTFASGGADVPCLGPYEVTPILATPAGSIPCSTVPVFVVPLSRYEPNVPGQLPTPAVSYAQLALGGQPT